jgi:hypothetical protein
MDSSLPHPAGYYPSTKTFKFRDNDAITSGKLKEEFFHAFQDYFYDGGTAQYADSGRVNIEFEAKLYIDVSNVKCCVGFHLGTVPQETKEQYENWIFSQQENPLTISLKDYQKWLNLFNQYTNKEYSSPLSPHLNTPDALNSIITLSKCF